MEDRELLRRHPHTPKALEKIAKEMGRSPAAVRRHLVALEMKRDLGKRTEETRLRNLIAITQEVMKFLPRMRKLKLEYKARSESDLKPEAWLLLFSDLHYGLRVNSAEVGGLGEYNQDVAKERVEYLSQTIGDIVRYYPNRPKLLVIAFLGDLIDNTILRGNQGQMTDASLIQQIIETVNIISGFIVAMTRFFPVVEAYGVPGNHPRLTRNPTDSIPADNFDNLIYSWVQDRLKNIPNVKVEWGIAQHKLLTIESWKFWLEHGDTVRRWMGIPFYGAKREKNNIEDMLASFNNYADYVVMGHHHVKAHFQGIYMNGSFIGGEQYSIGRLRQLELPCQVLLGINEKHGVVWERDISLINSPRQLKIKVYSASRSKDIVVSKGEETKTKYKKTRQRGGDK